MIMSVVDALHLGTGVKRTLEEAIIAGDREGQDNSIADRAAM